MNNTEIKCPGCHGIHVIKHGVSQSGKQRYYCKNELCEVKSFQAEHIYNGCIPGIEEQIISMTSKSKGIRETARLLHITTDKVMSTLKKRKYYGNTVNSNEYAASFASD